MVTATSSTCKGPLREAEKMRLLSDVTPACNTIRPVLVELSEVAEEDELC